MTDCRFEADGERGRIVAENGLLLLMGITRVMEIDPEPGATKEYPTLAGIMDPRGFTTVASMELADALEAAAKWIRVWGKR
jgi:hypothetical protein